MALFDSLRETREAHKRQKEEIEAAELAVREEFKQKIMQSELVLNILSSIDAAKDMPENSWIALAEDYYDHDPREVSVDKDGDGIKIQRVHYYDEVDTFQMPAGNGGYCEKQATVHKCQVMQQLAYGFVKSDFKPIDSPRTITTSTGHSVNYSVEEIRSIVEEIVYERLQQLFPQCEFKGRVTNKLGSEESVGVKMEYLHDLTYFVPEREYKEWY